VQPEINHYSVDCLTIKLINKSFLRNIQLKVSHIHAKKLITKSFLRYNQLKESHIHAKKLMNKSFSRQNQLNESRHELILSYLTSRVTTDTHGIENDEIEIDLLMTQFLPEILPIKGQRIKFYYPGIKVLCLRCYKSGHPKWECNQQFKTNWLEYVLKFYKADVVSDEMLGTWVDTLKEYHPEFQQQKPVWSDRNKDLRKNLDENHKALRRANGIRQDQPEGRRGRGRQQPNQHNYQAPQRGGRGQSTRGGQRGGQRGQPRGRGGRGRGLNYNPNLNPAFGNRGGQFYSDVANNLYNNRN